VRAMRWALGLCPHTGWAACIVAGGSLDSPYVDHRERLELLGSAERFVFHRAAQMKREDAERWVARAQTDAVGRALAALTRLTAGRDVGACGIVAKAGALPQLDTILASHPRMHMAEGIFYRDVLTAAASATGLAPRVIAPSRLDVKDARLVAAGRAAGGPWNRDWKIAALAAWTAL
jgi:hypothetical protein